MQIILEFFLALMDYTILSMDKETLHGECMPLGEAHLLGAKCTGKSTFKHRLLIYAVKGHLENTFPKLRNVNGCLVTKSDQQSNITKSFNFSSTQRHPIIQCVYVFLIMI